MRTKAAALVATAILTAAGLIGDSSNPAAALARISLQPGKTTLACVRGTMKVLPVSRSLLVRCWGTRPVTTAAAVLVPSPAVRRVVCALGGTPKVVAATRSSVTVRCPRAPTTTTTTSTTSTTTSTTSTTAPSSPPAGGIDYPWSGASQPVAPDGRPICSAEVHARYSVEIGGVRYATWHPPIDPVTGCAFGHEHGSDPSQWAHAAVLGGPITFGVIGAAAGVSEPHAGFKVYAVDRDRHGLGWLVVLHQGSAGPRRAAVRHHSMQIWMVEASTGRLLARVSTMADFGDYVPNCTPSEIARLGPAFAPPDPHAVAKRVIPAPQCESVYEQWVAEVNIGGFFGGRPGFDIDNAITQVDPLDPTRVIFNKPFACGPHDPAGWDSYCKGDKRSVIAPGWWLRPGSPGWFRTDIYGRLDPNGPLLQWVDPTFAHQVPWSEDCCGADNVHTATDERTGGFTPGANPGISFEGPFYCVVRWN